MATTTVPSWIQTAEQWSGYVGGLLVALSKQSATASGTPSASAGASLNVGLDPLPEATAGINLIGDALKLTETITEAKNSPQYLAAVAAQNDQNDTDEILNAVASGDLDTLRRMSSL